MKTIPRRHQNKHFCTLTIVIDVEKILRRKLKSSWLGLCVSEIQFQIHFHFVHFHSPLFYNSRHLSIQMYLSPKNMFLIHQDEKKHVYHRDSLRMKLGKEFWWCKCLLGMIFFYLNVMFSFLWLRPLKCVTFKFIRDNSSNMGAYTDSTPWSISLRRLRYLKIFSLLQMYISACENLQKEDGLTHLNVSKGEIDRYMCVLKSLPFLSQENRVLLN